MIEVLVVDDSEEKRTAISALLQDLDTIYPLSIRYAGSASSALEQMEEIRFDIVLLDVVIPVREGDAPQVNGCRRLLSALERARSGTVSRHRVPTFILAMSRFEDARVEIGEQLAKHFAVCLTWDDSEAWRDEISRFIQRTAEAMGEGAREHDVDFLVVAALHTERDAFRSAVGIMERIERDDDPTIYYRARVDGLTAARSVVCCSVGEAGMVHAAALCAKAIEIFVPRVVIMCGISAGVGAQSGDILVADQVWDYESGKHLEDSEGNPRFLPNPRPIPISSHMRSRLLEILDDNQLQWIQGQWTGGEVPEALRCHFGPVGCGAAVVEAASSIADIKAGQRKLIGVEMEGYGVAVAVTSSRRPLPQFCVVKSVSDAGVHPKLDDFQEYARFTSAAATLAIVKKYPLPGRRRIAEVASEA